MEYIDVRSDTVTWPTEAMREAMAGAAVGDDVYGDDPTVNELEAYAARLVGKEAALFVPSGTFGNQLALFAWCPRGTEVILGEDSHIIQHEAGAAAVIAGVQTRTVPAPDGNLTPEAIRARFRTPDIHHPDTSLICLENAHSSGRTVPLAAMDAAREVAREAGIPIHLDGARLFNAATALGVPASVIASRVDSVMFCLSKGLCAPVGSMLAGPASFIADARRKRKIMGGGLRQAGVLAAAGLVALKDMTGRLGTDHRNAKILAAKLSAIPGVSADPAASDINMVFFSAPELADDAKAAKAVAALKARGILVNPPSGGVFRFVTHYWVGEEQIDTLASAFAEALNGVRG